MGKLIDTKDSNFKIRIAEEGDEATILSLIRELAAYENLLDEVKATEEILRQSLFETKAAEVIIGEYDGKPVSYALFFYNFSTFLGKPGLYLEDIYVKPELRGKGLGNIMLSFLAKLAVERNCERFDWICLDWNESSIKFYKQLGAVPMEDWTIYRLADKALMDMAEKF